MKGGPRAAGTGVGTGADDAPEIASGAAPKAGRSPTRESTGGTVAGEHAGKLAAADDDGDNEDGRYYDRDDGTILYYGQPASIRGAQAIERTVRLYFEASARGDGTAACSELSAHEARSIPVDYGHIPGTRTDRGRTCPTVMTALSRQLHQQFSVENARLELGVARVEGPEGRVLLGFEGGAPNRYMLMRRERGTWKIGGLEPQTLP